MAVLATHPIQYHVPIFKKLAARDDVSLHAFFASDMSIRGYNLKSGGFGVNIQWDVPLLEGYRSTFLKGRSWLENFSSFFKHDRPEIAKVLRTEKFDALLLFCSYTMLLTLRAVFAARKAGIPVLIRGDNSDSDGITRPWFKERFRRLFLRWFYSNVTSFLAVGKYMQRHFIDLGIPKEQIFSCPHCIDDERFNAQRLELLPKREQFRNELGFGADDFIFLFCGRLIPKKNAIILAEAIEKLSSLDSICLMVVGDGEDRPSMQERLERAAGRRAVFVGFKNQSELARYYIAADAFVICSSFGETWGLVVNEAQIFGLPVIASDRVGCREDLVIESETGMIFPAGDSDALAACMRRLSTDRELSARMGKNAMEKSRNYRVADAVEGIVKAVQFAVRKKNSRNNRD